MALRPKAKVPGFGDEELFVILTIFTICLLLFSKSQLPFIIST